MTHSSNVMRKSYGGRVTDPTWDLDRRVNQIWGVPTPSDLSKIYKEMDHAKYDEALGAIFIENADDSGHIVAVRKEGGKPFFYDPQNGLEGSQLDQTFAEAQRIWFYRVN